MITNSDPSCQIPDQSNLDPASKQVELEKGSQPGAESKDEHGSHEGLPHPSEKTAPRPSSELPIQVPHISPESSTRKTTSIAERVAVITFCSIAVVLIFLCVLSVGLFSQTNEMNNSPTSIFVTLGLSIAAGSGAFSMFVGNAILRSTHHEGYVSNRTAAIIGAVGGIFGSMISGTQAQRHRVIHALLIAILGG